VPFVVDASVSAAWGLANESSPVADAADARLETDVALVPRIWWYEVRNLLLVNERRQRITEADSATFLRLLSSYPIEIDAREDEAAIFRLAREYRLSFYDAAYLELARRQDVPLATLDKALAAAARGLGVPLLQ
jgi:predicted nucleic acid-binding protein